MDARPSGRAWKPRYAAFASASPLPDGFLDLFRGSHTERVVREIDCPVLAIPSV
jgi:hypothetical protein